MYDILACFSLLLKFSLKALTACSDFGCSNFNCCHVWCFDIVWNASSNLCV